LVVKRCDPQSIPGLLSIAWGMRQLIMHSESGELARLLDQAGNPALMMPGLKP